jgi:acetylornithine/succinyldiaminopimelate/putrescine aminotransferase
MARIKQTKSAFVRGSEADEVQVVGAKGSYVFGGRNRKYIDFLDGWCVGNLGWDHREIKRAIRRFKGPDYVYPGFGYRFWEELAALLVSVAPGKLARCFRATGGSEAVDLAMQAAMLHTSRRGFVSLEDSYHGNTLATLSIGASENRQTLKNLLPHCRKIEPPLDGKAAAKVETMLKKRDIAAFIMEPISINLGVLVPDQEFIDRVQAACKRSGTLFIADEVACGFYRTGALFASEHFGLKPDILCLAKAITGGAGGLGAMLATAPVAKSLDEEGNAYSSYGWHPLSTAAALASVRYMVRHRKRLLDHVERMSDFFRRSLSQIHFEHPPAIRARGMAFALDFDDEDYPSKLHGRCRDKGLLFSAEGSTLLLLPALNIPRKTAQEGLDILQRCA